jgi:type II secretory pathway component GspD/PulD (secretin)
MGVRRGISGAFCLAVLGMLVLPGSSGVRAWADDPPKAAIASDSGMTVADLLANLSRATNIPVLWDPNDKAIRGKMITTPKMGFEAPRKELFSRVRSILTFFDLVMVPIGPSNDSMYLVMDARQTQSILKLKPQWVEVTDTNVQDLEAQDGFFVTTAIGVRNLTDLRDLRQALSRVVTPQNIGTVQEVTDARMLVVTDFAPNVAAAYRLVRMMDVPSAKEARSDFQIVHLSHAPAGPLAQILREQFQPAAQRPQISQQPQQTPPLTDPPVRVHADERTNSLLVSGLPEDVKRVLAAVQTLDAPLPQPPSETRILRIQTLRAEGVLNSLVSLIESARAQWPDRPGLTTHMETNSVIVVGSSAAVQRITGLVKELEALANPK